MTKLDRKLARMVQKYQGKFYYSEGGDIEVFLKVHNFILTKTDVLIICFGITKTPTLGYLLQYLNVTENEITQLNEITQSQFMTTLEEMKAWVDLGTLYDE